MTLTEICERGLDILRRNKRQPSASNLQALLWELLTLNIPEEDYDQIINAFKSGGYEWSDIKNWHIANYGKNRSGRLC